VIEGLRTDSLYLGSIRVSQLLSAILIVFGVLMFVYRRKHAPALREPTDGDIVSDNGTVSAHVHESSCEDTLQEDIEQDSTENDSTIADESSAGESTDDET
jgi:hypothetical protein